jgi:hypothetical protein
MAQIVPTDGISLEHAASFAISSAGAESNVAVSLARLGTSVAFASRLGNDPLGRRFTAQQRAARGRGRPETFDFLGFTHICGKTRGGDFQVRRITISKRMRTKLGEVKDELMRRRHLPIPEQGRWLGSVVHGHFAYYGVPGNIDAIAAFRTQVTRHWHRALQRRSQRAPLNWKRTRRFVARWLPTARVQHPFPEARFDVRTRGRNPVR